MAERENATHCVDVLLCSEAKYLEVTFKLLDKRNNIFHEKLNMTLFNYFVLKNVRADCVVRE